ncbi:MAG: hypothetical protein IPP81_09670 [Chitinophagaceae bacterium]|nr:hypothetical protein [Chitinophagaceae bacterium]
MSKLPAITAPIQILRLEVWVTNRMVPLPETRDVVGLANLRKAVALLQVYHQTAAARYIQPSFPIRETETHHWFLITRSILVYSLFRILKKHLHANLIHLKHI